MNEVNINKPLDKESFLKLSESQTFYDKKLEDRDSTKLETYAKVTLAATGVFTFLVLPFAGYTYGISTISRYSISAVILPVLGTLLGVDFYKGSINSMHVEEIGSYKNYLKACEKAKNSNFLDLIKEYKDTDKLLKLKLLTEEGFIQKFEDWQKPSEKSFEDLKYVFLIKKFLKEKKLLEKEDVSISELADIFKIRPNLEARAAFLENLNNTENPSKLQFNLGRTLEEVKKGNLVYFTSYERWALGEISSKLEAHKSKIVNQIKPLVIKKEMKEGEVAELEETASYKVFLLANKVFSKFFGEKAVSPFISGTFKKIENLKKEITTLESTIESTEKTQCARLQEIKTTLSTLKDIFQENQEMLAKTPK